MRKQYFIALLPELSKQLREKLERIHELTDNLQFKLPFHLTIGYLGTMSDVEKNVVINLIENLKTFKKFSAKNQGLNLFKNNENFIYHLSVYSNKIRELNQKFCNFGQEDMFDFKPHITLFYSERLLNHFELQLIKNIFDPVKTIKFKGIYLGYVENEQTYIEGYVEFNQL